LQTWEKSSKFKTFKSGIIKRKNPSNTTMSTSVYVALENMFTQSSIFGDGDFSIPFEYQRLDCSRPAGREWNKLNKWLLGGVNSFNLLRSIVEVEAWAEKLEGGGGALLNKTRAVVVNWLGGSGLGRRTNVEERLLTVPKGVKGYEKVYLRCTGWTNMPERVTPLCRAGEQAIISTLVRELKDNFGVRVSEKLILDRDIEIREGGE
jgi:hypothetical protein